MTTLSPRARCLQASTQQLPGLPIYGVSLAIADQPVKPSRRALQSVNVAITQDGKPATASDISVGFHPLDQSHAHRFMPGELVLAPCHASLVDATEFQGSLNLQQGEYEVDVTIDHRLHASFIVRM